VRFIEDMARPRASRAAAPPARKALAGAAAR
jgi:hypothetical protein